MDDEINDFLDDSRGCVCLLSEFGKTTQMRRRSGDYYFSPFLPAARRFRGNQVKERQE